MNTPNDADIAKLIQESYTALKSGDKEEAGKLAQEAADLSPDCEKAWLILASLSKEDQSLHYLEKALRANPKSQAAREGIRVIFAQMAAGKKPDLGEPAVKLEDTAPIPVRIEPDPQIDIKSAPQPVEKTKVRQDRKKSAIKGKLIKHFIPESDANLSAEIPPSEMKRNLREKLSKAHKIESETAPAQETRVKVKIKKKAKIEILPEQKAQAGNHTVDIMQGTEVKPVPDAVDLPAPSEETPAPAIPDNETRIVAEKVLDQTAEQQPIRAAVKEKGKEKLKATMPKPPARKKPKKVSRPVKKKKGIKQPKKKSGEHTNSDVDVIELILISAAAILLPIMTFLYFLLK